MTADPYPYVQGVLGGTRAQIARTITLLESTRPDHQSLAQQILTDLLPHAGGAIRIGITGVPGVGKSTFIDAFGSMLIQQGHRVAVLAIDPSSRRTGGSILGDKTRMQRLAVADEAFVRGHDLDGAALAAQARRTRSLRKGASFLSLVRHLKERAPLKAAAVALSDPAALRHLRMPIAARWRRLSAPPVKADAG